MAIEKDSTPPPTTTSVASSPVAPNPKRAKMSSPDRPAEPKKAETISEQPATTESAAVAEQVVEETFSEDDALEAVSAAPS